ncbi:hypothetical protein BDN70DRAFT_874313 [Pholiota conissans]|uniref:F-box domain-containing protein n=1 Tax=Pholiota conissans TaxID=109636 RepID=A0A9P5Z8V6_9AGAR|nr:hypothetical protein BDN70DRAFT_874313 [Pholiota conissans]
MPAFASPFTKELRTNHVPSLRDRGHIQSLLIEPRKRLSEMNSKISELERSLNELKRERDILEEEIEQHALLLTPFRRLPDDMLREIFIACLQDDRNAFMSCREAPLLLGLVCRKWRDLAYSTPTLWASLHIPYPVPVDRTLVMDYHLLRTDVEMAMVEKHYTAVKDWLHRSGACPLSISFCCVHLGGRGQNMHMLQGVVETYVKILLDFSQRWRSLELFIPFGRCLNPIADLPATSVPNLKHLRLTFSHDVQESQSSQWSSSSLLTAPTLKTLYISFMPFRLSSVPNKWDHLTSLTLSSSTPFLSHNVRTVANLEEAYAIFNKCRRLVHCALDIFDVPAVATVSGVLSLPHLKSLSIIDSCKTLSTLFECFADMASIRGISYHSNVLPSNHRQSPLITLLERTDKQIEFLELDSRHFTFTDLTTIFDLASNVRHLVETWTSRDILPVSRSQNLIVPESFNLHKVFLNLLVAPRRDGGMYFPRLLSLHLGRPCKLSDMDILFFLQQRMEGSLNSGSGGEGIVPLQRMSIKLLSHNEEIDISSRLSKYSSLKVEIGRPDPRRLLLTPKMTIDPGIGCAARPIPAIILALD